ncbi:MAG TPA: class I SAM-dependent methyltransferase [Terracidiphilus sp.]|nr:class I SAM-dependent methyltransferase [Terracidiphilus sp.]
MSGFTHSAKVRAAVSTLFEAVQESFGVSVTPSHFYFPIPKLKSFNEKDWNAVKPCRGLDFRLDEQLDRLHRDILPFAHEWTFPRGKNGDWHKFHFNNGFFECVDAEVAYSFVRRNKPRRMIEVGSGNSTLLLATAARKNAAEGSPCDFISIEPNPAPFLQDGVPGLTQLIAGPVQKAPLELFRTLRANDILFIDSSHVVSIDSDVVYVCLRVLPELAPGVIVHFHDIFAPLDYPEKFVRTNLCFWNEQYMLEAFLSFNSAFRILWSSSAMQQFRPDVLRESFPAWDESFARMPSSLQAFVPSRDGKRVWPCSLWITRTFEFAERSLARAA